MRMFRWDILFFFVKCYAARYDSARENMLGKMFRLLIFVCGY